VYSALEVSAERCAAASLVFRPLHTPHELARTQALETDMCSLFGEDWRDDPRNVPSAAAMAYISRLAHVAEYEPELMVAHSYTRYLGDLSGGQVLMRIARRMLHLEPVSSRISRELPYTYIQSCSTPVAASELHVRCLHRLYELTPAVCTCSPDEQPRRALLHV